jgi:hypothetical protein
MHEYGHTLDSQYWGVFYLPAIGIPSGISSWKSTEDEHHHYWTETRANNKASRYFKKHYGIDWLSLSESSDYPTN